MFLHHGNIIEFLYIQPYSHGYFHVHRADPTPDAALDMRSRTYAYTTTYTHGISHKIQNKDRVLGKLQGFNSLAAAIARAPTNSFNFEHINYLLCACTVLSFYKKQESERKRIWTRLSGA